MIQYIVGLTNLNGIIRMSDVVRFYNSQSKESVSENELKCFSKKNIDGLKALNVHLHQNFFVHHTIMANDDFEELIKKKRGKPYYFPEKSEVVKYIDEGYLERSKAYINLLEFLIEFVYDNEPIEAEYLCYDIHGMFKYGAEVSKVLNFMKYQKVKSMDCKLVFKLTVLLTDLKRNVRTWENNGLTDMEVLNVQRNEKKQAADVG